MLKKTLLVSTLLLLALFLLAACGPADEPDPDGVTAASVATNQEELVEAAGEEGTWIIIFEEDITVDEEIMVTGEFTHRDEVTRKLALYATDEDQNVTQRYTLETPRLVIDSENTTLQGGTLVGDVYVQQDGFALVEATIEGDLIFADEAYEATSTIDDDSEVTGTLSVE